MREKSYRDNHDHFVRATFIMTGIALNVLLSFITSSFNLPIYLDSIGTIVVAVFGGIFPGIVTGVLTNAFCLIFNNVAFYFGSVNALIAIYSSWFVKNHPKKNAKNVVLLILGLGLISGTISALIQWRIYLAPENPFVAESINDLAKATGLPSFVTFLFINILFDLMDKAISVGIALNIMYFIPQSLRTSLLKSVWRQTPIGDDEKVQIREWSREARRSMGTRLIRILLSDSIILTVIMGIVAVRFYYQKDVDEFMWQILFIMGGVIILILAYGLWTASAYMVYPISSMALAVERFINAGSDPKKLDKAIRELRKLNIHTDDEVEKLYYSICNMALSQAEQMRSIQRLSDSTANMQDGLIVTMADLVESRGTNTGSHIQKTSAYVKIIVEGLQKKGYYAGKMTPKFVSDVVRSAPLHDIGKINIPDELLKKEEPLTEEERETVKMHTKSGRKIIENAISTVAGENYLKEARNMAAYHHERWDGEGYPEQLHGEVIPLSARIMAVAEAFDEMTSPGNGAEPVNIEKAIGIIEDEAGTRFDPKCVEAFMEMLPEIKVVYRKYNKNL